jgi:hypothetical protein
MMGEHPSEARILLAFDRELDAGEMAQVMTHLDACPPCRATWEQLASLSGEIEQYCHAWPAAQTPVAHTLVAQTPAAETPADRWWQRRWRPRVTSGLGALAAAAALLLAIAGGVALLRGGSNAAVPTHTQDIRLASAAMPTAPVATAALTPTPTPTAPPRRARGSGSTRTAARAAAAAATAASARRGPTYYWALPYANGALPLSEGAVVMTVRLSRDQLRLAGIPVSLAQPASDQSLVRARVLVGADGLPRAISFDQN